MTIITGLKPSHNCTTHQPNKIVAAFNTLADPHPCLIMDLDTVERQYWDFRAALPMAEIFYAVKANPDAAILKRLAAQGSSFDAASRAEIEMALRTGVTPDRISFGNTIKTEADIAFAYAHGVRLFSVDAREEVEKIARIAPQSDVICRLLIENDGAEWPLSRKFGCDVDMAVDVLCAAKARGLNPIGITFHVGSQQTNPQAWHNAIALSATLFKQLEAQDIYLNTLNLGGGFPASYDKPVHETAVYGAAIQRALRANFGPHIPRIMIEPGRGMVGDAGILRAQVVLVSKKSKHDDIRWVYLNIGRFGGLAETEGEAIRYRLTTDHSPNAQTGPCIIAGPTCDSVDVLYERKPRQLPLNLKAGDYVYFHGAGAYTTTYASVGFNGFAPPKTLCL